MRFKKTNGHRFVMKTVPTLGSLADGRKELIMKSKADNTVKTYNCNFKQWCKWCSDFNLSPLPSTEYHVSLYVTFLVQEKLSVAKVEQSLYAIKWAHELAV